MKDKDLGEKCVYVHPSADVQTSKIGSGTTIWQNVVILDGAIIGEGCNICAGSFIERDVVIGNNVTIKCCAQIYDGVTIEDSVFIGPGVVFCNDRFPKSKNKDFKMERCLVKKGASIGANSTILPGRTIGENALVAAGSVVTKDVEDEKTFLVKKVK